MVFAEMLIQDTLQALGLLNKLNTYVTASGGPGLELIRAVTAEARSEFVGGRFRGVSGFIFMSHARRAWMLHPVWKIKGFMSFKGPMKSKPAPHRGNKDA